MQIYFSHSYRDVAVNGYFIERLNKEDIPLRADQKTDIWCVAKLERYLAETTGFISVIPRRPTDHDPAGYSPYIGQELNLARRARVPRLLFVDEQILKAHRLDFPEDAVPFGPDTVGEDAADHDAAIRRFRVSIETAARADRRISPNEAAVIASGAGVLSEAARDAAEILRRHEFRISPLFGRFEDRGLDDIRLLEALWRAELCVFLLHERLSDGHIALAMAHAHCIPSIRLQYDRRVSECQPTVSGTIRWRDQGDMLVELERQVSSYRRGLISPVEIAQAASGEDAARAIGTMRWRPRDDNLWVMHDGTAFSITCAPIRVLSGTRSIASAANMDRLWRMRGAENPRCRSAGSPTKAFAGIGWGSSSSRTTPNPASRSFELLRRSRPTVPPTVLISRAYLPAF
jgi:hypothetical protein